MGISALLGAAQAAEKSLPLKTLPAAVQKTVEAQAKGAAIKSISRETEKGKVQYEIETMVNGKHRDFIVDAQGALGDVEEEAALAGFPPAAKAAIEKKAAGGTIGLVETLSRGGATYYEAAYTLKNGKKGETIVKADGTEIKD